MSIRILSFFACCVVLCGLGLAQLPAETVERWDTQEYTFKSTSRYRNPFREAWLRASFRHTSGLAISVDGFYDGEATWRVRFMPPELGRWDFLTDSNDAALRGQAGSMECVVPQKPYLHGPLLANGVHFRHTDGKWRFLISTRLSCHFAEPSVWNKVIPFLKEHEINRVLFMVPGIRGTSQMLHGSTGDPLTYNVEYFQKIDAFIDALRKADILTSPYFYYFNDGFQRGFTPEQDEAFLRYCMARFGAYANVMPVLANEVELKYSDRSEPTYDLSSHEWANSLGTLLRQLAVFGLPVSVHNPMESYEATRPGFFALLRDWPFPWTDFMLRQVQVGALGAAPRATEDVPEPEHGAWNARAYARQNEWLIALGRFNIPVINEEPGYELGESASWGGQTSTTLLATAWSATLAGAYIMWGSAATYELKDPFPELAQSATPRNLRTLSLIMNQLPFWEMKPRNDLVNENPVVIDNEQYRRNFALVQPGQYYLIYSLDGGDVEVKVEPGAYVVGTLNLTETEKAGNNWRVEQAAPSGSIHFSLQPGRQWIALLRRD